MTQRIIAIGDIHGCSRALATLIEVIRPTPDDLFIPLGDYIDRGPDSRGVIDQLIALGRRCRLVPLLGNHEEMLFAALAHRFPGNWLSSGGKATLDSYRFVGGLDTFPGDHLEFLNSCRNFHETEGHIFAHARYQADLPMDRQPTQALRWAFLDPCPPNPHYSGKVVIVGHTPQEEGRILDLGYLKCIDTFCHGGGWLTALEVESGQVWQADQGGRWQDFPLAQKSSKRARAGEPV